MSFPFLSDLDNFFCEEYANYDKLCVLDGYKMPVMQRTITKEDGRAYSYTLPSSTMRLADQENKAKLLVMLKEKMQDRTVSFSFYPIAFFARIKQAFQKECFYKFWKEIVSNKKIDVKQLLDDLTITKEVYTNVEKGKWLPSKNLVLSIALMAGLSLEETTKMLALCGEAWDFTYEKDVVTVYLLRQKVFNKEMIKAAFDEYKVRNLFIKF